MKLKEWLKTHGKTQESFADDIGVSRMTMNRAVNNIPPGYKTAKLIVEATQEIVTFNDIYS